MSGEKIGETQKIELSPLSRKEEVSRSFLQAWTKKFNERFKKSNDRESLVKGIAKLEGITTKQVEEKVKERRALVNEEEKPEDTFQEIAEKKGITPSGLKTSVERIKAKQQEEPIDVVPRPPMVRKFKRLIKDADKEYVMSEGEREILRGYAEDKRKAKEQRVGKYIEKLKKEKAEEDKKFPVNNNFGDNMEKKEPMPVSIINRPPQEESSSAGRRKSLKQKREDELNKGRVKVALEQIKMDRARTPQPVEPVKPVELIKKKESFIEKMKRIDDAKSKF